MFKSCGEGRKETLHFSHVHVYKEMIHVEMSLVGSYALHWTECLFCPVNWINEDEDTDLSYDSGMCFVSSTVASSSRPIARRRAI
jgi:hypothetical protein